MKYYFQVILLLTALSACSQAKEKMNSSDTVFTKKDDQGRIIEKWGNEGTWDNDVNFRYQYEYDSDGLLIEEKQYHFDDSNVECVIKDSLDYIHVVYDYDEQKEPLLKKKFFQVYSSSGSVIGHKLGYIYYYKTGLEEVVN